MIAKRLRRLPSPRRGLIAVVIAGVSGILIIRGVAMVAEPLGWIVAGLFLAGLLFIDLEPTRRVAR
jgi:hypothetical protein